MYKKIIFVLLALSSLNLGFLCADSNEENFQFESFFKVRDFSEWNLLHESETSLLFNHINNPDIEFDFLVAELIDPLATLDELEYQFQEFASGREQSIPLIMMNFEDEDDEDSESCGFDDEMDSDYDSEIQSLVVERVTVNGMEWIKVLNSTIEESTIYSSKGVSVEYIPSITLSYVTIIDGFLYVAHFSTYEDVFGEYESVFHRTMLNLY